MKKIELWKKTQKHLEESHVKLGGAMGRNGDITDIVPFLLGFSQPTMGLESESDQESTRGFDP